MGYHSNLHIILSEAKPWHFDGCRCSECRRDEIAARKVARLEPTDSDQPYRVKYYKGFGSPTQHRYCASNQEARALFKQLKMQGYCGTVQCRHANGQWIG